MIAFLEGMKTLLVFMTYFWTLILMDVGHVDAILNDILNNIYVMLKSWLLMILLSINILSVSGY